MKFQQTLISLFVIGTLSACGGSSSDAGTDPTVSLAGKAADGYLVDAKVCLDLNANKICDSDEPFAITSAGGVYTLADVTQAEIDDKSLADMRVEIEEKMNLKSRIEVAKRMLKEKEPLDKIERYSDLSSDEINDLSKKK